MPEMKAWLMYPARLMYGNTKIDIMMYDAVIRRGCGSLFLLLSLPRYLVNLLQADSCCKV